MSHTKIIVNIILLFGLSTLFIGCNGQSKKPVENKIVMLPTVGIGKVVSELGKNISCVFQDKNNNYWFASNGDGVYRYDGKNLTQITNRNGLLSNFVHTIQEDANGNLWFSTRDHICVFNGFAFIDYTDKIKNAPTGKLKFTKNGLFFGHLNGLCYYDGLSFSSFTIHPNTYQPSPTDMNRPYSVYSTLTDNKGNVWFGTEQKGVCRYDGTSFVFFTEQGLDLAAVRTLSQDKKGNIWAGNNGAGLFKFNGDNFVNFTDAKGLANRDFLKKLAGKEGTLARPFTINEDDKGNLLIGTIDAGIWRYDGVNLTNYTTKDGLTGNAIWTIYKDKSGELWFVVNGDSVFKFDGKSFKKFIF